MPTTRDFFLTEARDCLARLDALLRASDDSLVDAAELHRVSRVLRGSAQMARELRVQAVAHALELAARALVQGALAWGGDLRGLLEHTLEDLAALVEADGADAQLDERAAAALERWERQGLDLPAYPDAAAAPLPDGSGAGRPDAGPAPAFGDPAAPAGGPAQEELPVEVVNFFRSEAGALVERIERLAGERPQAGERHRGAHRELRDTVTALRDLAATFGFTASTAAAERLLEAVEGDGAAEGLVAEVRRLVTSEVPGQTGPLADSTGPVPGEMAVPDQANVPFGAHAGQPRAHAGQPRAQVEPGEGDVVPIEDLLYRGEAALKRALELRHALDRLAGEDAAARETVDELFDLIRLGLK